MEVCQIINKLQATTKRTEKAAILESIKDTPEENLFKLVAWLTYDPSITFGVKDVDLPSEPVSVGNLFGNLFGDLFGDKKELSLSEALDVLEFQISERDVTGNAAHELIQETFNSLSKNDGYVFKCVIDRDLKCGASAKTINKVWPDLIYVHPYMRASSFSEKNLKKIQFPCISQTKEDGEYEDIIIHPESETFEVRSRSGAINNHHISHDMLLAISNLDLPYSCVLMGEILVYETPARQKLMPRQKGNGYLNSSEVDPERLLHVLWDVVPYKDFKEGICNTPYVDRFERLKAIVDDLREYTDQVKPIDSRIVNSVDEVIEHFMENIKDGLEGTLVKNQSAKWKDGTSNDFVKIKTEFTCDLIITGFNQGKTLGEWDEVLGSLICESLDGKLVVNVGTGLTDELRKSIWENQELYLGKIGEIKSNDIIASETKPDTMSLFLPRLVKFRNDKTQADSYDRIVEQKEAFVHTLEVINED
jgi:DNA ligase-1